MGKHKFVDIGKRIKELRKEMGLSQTGLASLIGTTQDTISLWELGKSYPDIIFLVSLCKVFKVSADFLLCLEI